MKAYLSLLETLRWQAKMKYDRDIPDILLEDKKIITAQKCNFCAVINFKLLQI